VPIHVANSSDRETNGRVSGRAGDRRRASARRPFFFGQACPHRTGVDNSLRFGRDPRRIGTNATPLGARFLVTLAAWVEGCGPTHEEGGGARDSDVSGEAGNGFAQKAVSRCSIRFPRR
jgi:hypothetical protein